MFIDFCVMVIVLGVLFCIIVQVVVLDVIDLLIVQVQVQLLDMLEKELLYCDCVDWWVICMCLKVVQNDLVEVCVVFWQVIGCSFGGYGVWISVKQLQVKVECLVCVNGVVIVVQKVMMVLVEVFDLCIGWVEIEGYGVMQGLMVYQQMKECVKCWQVIIDDQDNGSCCGWIVDLCGNIGGNMWFMLLGVVLLLCVMFSVDENVGFFVVVDGLLFWQLILFSVCFGDCVWIDFGGFGYLFKYLGVFVVVLIGLCIVSFGEVIVFFFRGWLQMCSFGQFILGLFIVNVMWLLVDGSVLLLIISVMWDCNDCGDGLKIEFDQFIEGDVVIVVVVQVWLLVQFICWGNWI